ncbi:hypothetical protein [Rhizobium leguminosarum]|uniref:hypothetical protein n=1 Tax=Rhizobium leguminosarum TaxID=384 RepID=UPI0014421D84|nr:hypothetical protein [Rhizobium leguminosarum]MBY5863288.1 hypothetical protein [Rhizobium leguminosarum]NKM04167.1 hypothetical protein [Rhizobium leguminosarum bv. viciae]
MATITLTLEVTEEERAKLVERFIATANAVVEPDEGVPSDPNGSKVDITGVVWDARYHGANMSKNQDQTWRRKKGLSEQEKADADAYEAGCRGAPAATAQAAVAAPVAPVQPTGDVPSFLQTGSFAPSPVMPGVGMPSAIPGMPAAPQPPAPVSYQEMIGAFQAAIGRVGEPRVQGELGGIYQRAGVTEMVQLETDGDKRIAVKNELDKLV